MLVDPAALVVEANRRDGLRNGLHLRQQTVREDKSQFRLLRCSRRSGKTHWALADIIDDHWDWPNEEYAYIALTRSSAQRIAWPIVKKLNRKYGLQLRLRESIGRVEFPNGAGLTIYGADRDDWAERIYGQSLRKIKIDEASWFRGVNMKYLIDDVCSPCLVDTDGQLSMMSIPSPYMKGHYYYEADKGREPGWSQHRWTWMENPHIRANTFKFLSNKLKADPKFFEQPGVVRNWLNKWVDEIGMRVYRWEESRNAIDDYEITLANVTKHHFILGVDFGWTHRTGFVVLCWSDDSPTLIELESYAKSEMTTEQISDRIKAYQSMYPGLRVVGDPDAQREFGDLTRRYNISIEPAEKANKKYWIDLYNTELGAKRIKTLDPESSPHVAEMLEGRWESRAGVLVRNVKEELVEPKGWRNDCCDAGLYAFREAWNYLYRTPLKPPEPGSAEYFAMIEDQMIQYAEQNMGG